MHMNCKLSFILALMALALPTAVGAQQVDLTQDALKDLDLELVTGNSVSNSGVYVYRDLTYFHLFTTHKYGWAAGDGVYSTPLPDGNTFWSFGDSFFSLVGEYRNLCHPTNLPRNAGMIQTGEKSWKDFIVLNDYVSTDPNDHDHYYEGKTWIRHPKGEKTQEQVNAGEVDSEHYYWPGDATVIKRDGKTILQMLMGSGDPGMVRDETMLMEFSLEGKPGDGHYMKDSVMINNLVPFSAGYGSGILEDADGHTYLYSSVGTGGMFGGAWGIVARSETHDLRSPWEYWIKDSVSGEFRWQKEVPTTVEMRRSNITSDDWIAEPSVFKYGDYYYMCTQDGTNGNIYILQAEHPWGPFGNRKAVYDVPDTHNATYNSFVHPQLSRTGEIVVSYNMNPADLVTYTKGSDGKAVENTANGFWRNFNARGSADLYQPHFIRIFNWQSLFGVPNTGAIQDVGIEEYNKME